MDVGLAREAPNATFDARGRRLTFEYRNDTAHHFGRKILFGGLEYAPVRHTEAEPLTSEPTLLTCLGDWLVARTGSAQDEAGVDELISRCVEAGAPVRG
jgi:hypothetical protein